MKFLEYYHLIRKKYFSASKHDIEWRHLVLTAQSEAILKRLDSVEIFLKQLGFKSTEKHLHDLELKIQNLENKVNDLSDIVSKVRDQQLTSAEEIRNLKSSYLPQIKFESFDLALMSRITAGLTSAQFFNEYLYDKKMFDSDLDLLTWCAAFVDAPDLVLEFGVFSGRTINNLAEQLPNHNIFGFDSFEGLPETWRSEFPMGSFRTEIMPKVHDNVILIKGWFDKSLPPFLTDHSGEIGLLHIDCDLYSSTKTIFDLTHDRIKNGAIIIFDEFFNYPGWEHHEYRAFKEFTSSHGFVYEYLAANPRHQQVAVRVWRKNQTGGSRLGSLGNGSEASPFLSETPLTRD